MTDADVKNELTSRLDATTWPVLTSTDLDGLVAKCKLKDAAGLAPSATGWAPTYNVDLGELAGWRLKMARVASRYNSATDGTTLNRGDLIKQYKMMADEVAARIPWNASIVRSPSGNLNLNTDLPLP